MTRLTVLVCLALLAACSFEPTGFDDLQCENGDLSDGRRCEDGYWVTDRDVSVVDGGADAGPTDGGECVPESDDNFCRRVGKDCGIVTGTDNCGEPRQTSCGECQGSDDCVDNVCDCEPESDDDVCQRLGKDCGTLAAADNCGDDRIVDCGECPGAQACGEVTDNVCGCPCDIDGICYPDGARNPVSQCQTCDPSRDPNDWSPADGAICDDGNPCTENDTCKGLTCDGEPIMCSAPPDDCKVAICDPQTGGCVEQFLPDGEPCSDDGASCTIDRCDKGACLHPVDDGFCHIGNQCVTDGTVNPANACQECDANEDVDDWSPRSGSCSDGLSCTTDTCENGQCVGTPEPGFCVINGNCVPDGTPEGPDSCRVCDADADPLAWTVLSQGSTCPVTDSEACTDDVCSGSGECARPLADNCCDINGRYFTDGDPNPSNECEHCDPTGDQTSWSGVTAGIDCNGGNCACDGMGVCRNPGGQTCN